jgi:hypothetical protein
MFDYEAKGTIKIVGCAKITTEKNYIVKFLEGSRAFVRKKARLGKLESIVIKRVRRVPLGSPSRYGIQPEIMYTDTFNRVWEESELISQEDAVDLAMIYWQNISQEGRILFEQGGACLPIPSECD